jgi:hypothetical protein
MPVVRRIGGVGLQRLAGCLRRGQGVGGEDSRASGALVPGGTVDHVEGYPPETGGATLVDETLAEAFNAVAFMLAHPFSPDDPALVERAIAANQRAAADQ